MKVEVLKKVKIDISYIIINTHVRFWEDAYINGVEDNPDSPKMPLIEWDKDYEELRWKPVIDIDSGTVVSWPSDISTRIHYKVCDEFVCYIPEIDLLYEGYVPRFMSPLEENYGDYIIMNINKEGKIEGWNSEWVKKFVDSEYKNQERK